MKRITYSILLSVLICGTAFSQFSGQLSTARIVDNGASMAGVYAGVYEDAIGLLGQYRYGLGGYTDLGIKLGMLDLDDWRGNDAAMDFSLDVKYQVMEVGMRDPFDLSIGGGLEFMFAEDVNIISLGLAPIGSYPIRLRNGRTLEPYGRLQMRVERRDWDYYNDEDAEFEIGLNMGTAFELSNSTRVLAEFQFDNQYGFFLGANFGL
ncbi:MAG: hypothetical protein A2W25_14550 [candidate division Zixibacteria bacterium RBG_16_53_22]|nr:MAG: hypothetical protein A2W25_14550 [candidate division Zixibacteria bacterium RBG_16_53_22]